MVWRVFFRTQPFRKKSRTKKFQFFRKNKTFPNLKPLISTLEALKECISDVGKDIILSVQTLQVK